MLCWLYWVMFGAWTLMVWNWYRMYQLQKEVSKDFDELADLADGLLRLVQSYQKRGWN